MGWLMTMILGSSGRSLAADCLIADGRGETAFQPSGWIMSILGAVIVLAIYSSAMAKKGA